MHNAEQDEAIELHIFLHQIGHDTDDGRHDEKPGAADQITVRKSGTDAGNAEKEK